MRFNELSREDAIALLHNAAGHLSRHGFTGLCYAFDNACTEAGVGDSDDTYEQFNELARTHGVRPEGFEGGCYWFPTPVSQREAAEFYEARLTALALLISVLEAGGLQ